jgi:hypothetical protein
LAPDSGPLPADEFLNGYTAWYDPGNPRVPWVRNFRIFLDPQPNGAAARVCWISGGKVAVAETGQLETPPEGVDTWIWNHVHGATDQQPFHRFANYPDDEPNLSYVAVSHVPYQANQAALLIGLFPSHADYSDQEPAPQKQLLCSFLSPACFPTFNQTTGLASFPPAGLQKEISGAIALRDGSAITALVEHPFVSEESGQLFIYGIWRTGQVPETFYFAKHALPDDSSTGWTQRWWGSLNVQVVDYGANKGFDPAQFSQYGRPPIPIDFPPIDAYLGEHPFPNPLLPTSYLYDAIERDWIGTALQLSAQWWPVDPTGVPYNTPFAWAISPDIAQARDLLPLSGRPLQPVPR